MHFFECLLSSDSVVIYFQICIFEPLETTIRLCCRRRPLVVIYFQICIFEPLETTRRRLYMPRFQLWFTFKFVSLNHWKQRPGKQRGVAHCCDLLSNLYLWTIGNNRSTRRSAHRRVVIYFQICIFEPLETTPIEYRISIVPLWFTFKFVSLNHWKQHISYIPPFLFCCDLLSNLYLWTIGNNIWITMK